MGRRTNIAYPVAFVLFVVALYYFTFVRLAAEDPAGTGAAAGARAEARAEAEDDGQRANGAGETRRVTLAQAPLDVAAPPVGKPVQVVQEGPAYDKRIGVLMMACNRPDVQRALDTLFRYKPADNFPVVLSQDCGDGNTAQVIDRYEDRLIHLQQPNLGPVQVPAEHAQFASYYKISRHYRWALGEMFDVLLFDQVIILEDDLDVSPDFFEYFQALLPVLRSDPTLWCVSAWNDNGKKQFLGDPVQPAALHRTDFFPGLGWMLTKDLWRELKPKWPGGFWDDWMRNAEQRKGRACITPEVSRTFTFGEVGVSMGQYYRDHLAYIVLNQTPVPFLKLDLSYLHKTAYDRAFLREVYEDAQPVSIDGLDRALDSATAPTVFVVTYANSAQFEPLALRLGLMSDLRAGVPRGAYMGVVSFRRGRHHVHLAPPKGHAIY